MLLQDVDMILYRNPSFLALAQVILASRIHVGLVVGLIYVLSMPIGIAPSLKLAIFMMGFCVIWATYLANVYTDKVEDEVNKAGIHVAVSPALIWFVALAPTPLVFDIMGWRGVVFMLVFSAVCHAYSVKLPVFKLRIKDIFLLKNIYPGLVVVGGLIMLRLLFGFPIFMADIVLIFLIYFGNEILWDIRDMQGDMPNSTIPQRLGLKATKALIVAIYLSVLAMYAVYWPFVLFAAWFPVLVVIWVTLKALPNQHPLLFHLPVLTWVGFLGFLLCL